MTSGCFPPPIPHTVNGVKRTLPYVLCDGIYVKRAILTGTSSMESEKEQYYSSHQELWREDAERVYGYLFYKWNIWEQLARFRRSEMLMQVNTCCAVLHNMVVSHSRKEPAVPQPGMCSAALSHFSVCLCRLLLLSIFKLVLTCFLLLKTGCGCLFPSLYEQGGAGSRVRRDRLFTQVGTAVCQSKLVHLLEMRRMNGEGHSPGQGLQTIQSDA